jgi:hypothetical protein
MDNRFIERLWQSVKHEDIYLQDSYLDNRRDSDWVLPIGLLWLAGALSSPQRHPLVSNSTIASAMFALGLAPADDAGFVIYPASMVLQWTFVGFLGGLCRAWWLKRKVATSTHKQEEHLQPVYAGRSLKRLFRVGMAHTYWSAVVLVLVFTAGYCVWQEIVLARDRDFFLRHVDHKAVSEACFDVLFKPEKERWQQVALYIGADPRLPEAIRRLEPKAVSIHVDEISITKTPRHFYNSLTFRQNRSDTNRYDLVYEEGPSSPRETCVYTMFASDRRPGSK